MRRVTQAFQTSLTDLCWRIWCWSTQILECMSWAYLKSTVPFPSEGALQKKEVDAAFTRFMCPMAACGFAPTVSHSAIICWLGPPVTNVPRTISRWPGTCPITRKPWISSLPLWLRLTTVQRKYKIEYLSFVHSIAKNKVKFTQLFRKQTTTPY